MQPIKISCHTKGCQPDELKSVFTKVSPTAENQKVGEKVKPIFNKFANQSLAVNTNLLFPPIHSKYVTAASLKHKRIL